MVLGMLSGCGEKQASGQPDVSDHSSLTEALSDNVPINEYQRAVWYNFVPSELTNADPDSTIVTCKQFCAMLGNMIARYDVQALSQWEEETAKVPDTEMKRDGGMVSLLFAAKAIGMAQFNADASTADYAPKVWEVVSMDYPVFKWNTPIDLGEGCSDENHVGPSYDFCLRRVSSLSGKSLLEFDANGDLRLEYPFTLREAVLSVARLYESDPNVLQELLKSAPPLCAVERGCRKHDQPRASNGSRSMANI